MKKTEFVKQERSISNSINSPNSVSPDPLTALDLMGQLVSMLESGLSLLGPLLVVDHSTSLVVLEIL